MNPEYVRHKAGTLLMLIETPGATDVQLNKALTDLIIELGGRPQARTLSVGMASLYAVVLLLSKVA